MPRRLRRLSLNRRRQCSSSGKDRSIGTGPRSGEVARAIVKRIGDFQSSENVTGNDLALACPLACNGHPGRSDVGQKLGECTPPSLSIVPLQIDAPPSAAIQ